MYTVRAEHIIPIVTLVSVTSITYYSRLHDHLTMKGLLDDALELYGKDRYAYL